MLFVITEIHLLLSKNCDKGKNLVNIDKSRFTMNSILTFKKIRYFISFKTVITHFTIGDVS